MYIIAIDGINSIVCTPVDSLISIKSVDNQIVLEYCHYYDHCLVSAAISRSVLNPRAAVDTRLWTSSATSSLCSSFASLWEAKMTLVQLF